LTLLDFKSKHAGLRESHYSFIISAAVVGFTIVTIIFAPLSFMTALLAVPIDTFQTSQTASTLNNGSPFYLSGFVNKWMWTGEIVSIAVTALAVWLSLELLGVGPVRKVMEQKKRRGEFEKEREKETLKRVEKVRVTGVRRVKLADAVPLHVERTELPPLPELNKNPKALAQMVEDEKAEGTEYVTEEGDTGDRGERVVRQSGGSNLKPFEEDIEAQKG
jgi:hypothetical protein